MKLSEKIISSVLTVFMASNLFSAAATVIHADNMFQNSDFVETEQPELSEETKRLISAYQRQPSSENYLNLRDMVISNYDAVLARKEAKLAELEEETSGKPGGAAKVAEMEEIVQDMYITYWNRINSSMLRFTDTRLLKWKISAASKYEYIPVMGAGESIYIKRTPVTNAEYAEFIAATGRETTSNQAYAEGEEDYPVNFVSYDDAKAYCDWLTQQDGVNTYRLPSESEWELAAGHMPKDADFNCGINDGRTPVNQYDGVTRGAHGAIDFWGNVWEWTSTVREENGSDTILGVKGGSWKSDRTDCRTEYRKEGRISSDGYDDVGFRVIQVKNGTEPEEKVELATLPAPDVSASASADSITLSWLPVENAVEYQIFEYFKETGLVKMLERTADTSFTISGLEPESTHSYIVQPISYREIADNVSAEYSVEATCGEKSETVENTENKDNDKDDAAQKTEKSENKEEKLAELKQLRELKLLAKATKIEQLTYLKEVRDLFKDVDKDERREVLAELAAIKEELKDYSVDTFVNGICIDYDKYGSVKPVIENGRTLAPVRAITEALGAEVVWDGETQSITITRDDIIIEMTVGSTSAYVNGTETELDTAPEIRNDRTLVPVRFIAESFCLNVSWDENSQSIIIEAAE